MDWQSAAKYLAGSCDLLVDVGRVESSDDDCDGDGGLSGGVDVLSRHCHRCTATTSRHLLLFVASQQARQHRDINKCFKTAYIYRQHRLTLGKRWRTVRASRPFRGQILEFLIHFTFSFWNFQPPKFHFYKQQIKNTAEWNTSSSVVVSDTP